MVAIAIHAELKKHRGALVLLRKRTGKSKTWMRKILLGEVQNVEVLQAALTLLKELNTQQTQRTEDEEDALQDMLTELALINVGKTGRKNLMQVS